VVSPTPAPAPQETPLQNILQEFRVRGNGSRSSVGASVGSAIEAVWSNRTRSLLTILGIVIGVAAVIGSLTLTQGVGAYVNNVITSQGANTIQIQPGTPNSRGPIHASLTDRDMQSIAKLQHVTAISPLVSAGNGQAIYGSQNWNTSVRGVSPDYQTINNWDTAQGLWFSPAEANSSASVAVIGDTVAHNLFGASGTDAIGKNIRFREELFRVVGVLSVRGGYRQDDVIFVPYKTVQARLRNGPELDEITVQVDTQDNLDVVVQALTTALEVNHHIPRGQPDDFQTQTSVQILQQSAQALGAITLLLTGIAAISLTVGGIGIMNIMLVSVTERTREIGIRISIGARRGDILSQFLIEALSLCLIGSILGLLLGLLIGWLVTGVILQALAGSSGTVPFVITPTSIILPFAVAFFIGLVFGTYPAVRASRLDPIVALRRAK